MADSDIDLTGFNPFDSEIQQCPHPYYRAMQRLPEAVYPVAGTDLHLVTRHDLVVPILRDTTTFSNNFGSAGEPPRPELVERVNAVYERGWPRVSTMLTIDPPYHTRFRGTVASYFTPRRMAELREPVVAIVNRLIDRWIDSGHLEFVAQFAVPLPIEAIAHILNVPTDKLDDFKRWSDCAIANIGNQLTDDEFIAAQEGVVEFQQYFAAQLEARRDDPQGDLLTDLVQARIDTDEGSQRPLEMAEMLSITHQLLVAGNETTTKALTEGLMLLAQHPEQWERLKADPAGRAPAVVEEVLRLSSPTQGMFRRVTKDTEIEGCPVPRGSRVVVNYSAANRDPAVWGEHPDAFDPDRGNLKEHLAFGKGIHFCLGAPLSRLEMTVAFETLARRIDTLSLDDTNTFEYLPSFMLRGLKRLEVSFTPRSASSVGAR
jgi:cytochrome P450